MGHEIKDVVQVVKHLLLAGFVKFEAGQMGQAAQRAKVGAQWNDELKVLGYGLTRPG